MNKKKLSGLSQREALHRVRNGDITLTKKMKKEIKELKKRKIDLSDPDAREVKNWKKAVVGKFYRPIKKQITIRIDADILDWFKHASKKYQPLINQACREFMEVHDKKVKK